MSFKQELTEKLETFAREIESTKSQMKTLTQRRTDALQRTDQSAAQTIQESKEIRDELHELQEKLEDLTIMRTTIQGKVAVYKNNEPKAAELRSKITGELYPKIVKTYNQIRTGMVTVEKLILELHELNTTTERLFQEHDKLTGERTVGYIWVNIDPTLAGFLKAGAHLPEAPETPTLRLQSEIPKPAAEKQVAPVAYMPPVRASLGKNVAPGR